MTFADFFEKQMLEESEKKEEEYFDVEYCDICGCANSSIDLLHNDGACFNCNIKLN